MLISNALRWGLVLFTIFNTCSVLEAAETKGEEANDAGANRIEANGSGTKHLYKRNVERQRMRRNRNRWANFRRMNNNQSNWLSFTPPTPNPDEVDCHIEVEVRRTVDGRCVRLGGQFQAAACQSGMHLDYFNNDCEAILTHRESGTQAGSATATGANSQGQQSSGSAAAAGGEK